MTKHSRLHTQFNYPPTPASPPNPLLVFQGFDGGGEGSTSVLPGGGVPHNPALPEGRASPKGGRERQPAQRGPHCFLPVARWSQCASGREHKAGADQGSDPILGV